MTFLNSIELSRGEKGKFSAEFQCGHTLAVWIACGEQGGPTLVITAGVHGCEFVGIQSARRFFETISTADFKGNILIFPLLNSEGFYHGSKQTVPADGKNLNRVFPGREHGTLSERIAHYIEMNVYPEADFILDLHGGDINERMTPLVFFAAAAGEEIRLKSRDAAMHMPVAYRVPANSKNGLYSWGAQCGVPGALLEIGGAAEWSEQEIALCLASISGVMKSLGMADCGQINAEQQESLQAVYDEASSDGFWYPCVTAGDAVRSGDLLGTLRDIDDTVLKEYRAQFCAVVLYHTTTLGVRSGDALVTYCRVN